ncbi:MAG TPA: NAD(P)-dependent methylenetetrahydromethanopterin dehydrogenase, partial [Pirellulaceae bacterium]
MGAARILIQLDPDPRASVFDAMVALDSGLDHLLTHAGITPEQVPALVHGAMFTRGVNDLRHTAIFIGGSDLTAGEKILAAVCRTFFESFRVSVMLDPNGANTTAATAVVAASQHVPLAASTVLLLGGTGAIGRRIARMLTKSGAEVWVGSRSLDRARAVCVELREALGPAGDRLHPRAMADSRVIAEQAAQVDVVLACGAAGVSLTSLAELTSQRPPQLVMDLNAVPPLGIEGVEGADRGV